MSFEFLSDLNWLAVLVGAVAWFLLGAAWYVPPPMAKIWASAGGIKVPEDQKPNPMVFLYTLVVYFVASVATALLAAATGTDTMGEGIVLGLVVGVGYAMTSALIAATYEMKPRPVAYVLFNGIFNLLGLTLVSVIVAVWE